MSSPDSWDGAERRKRQVEPIHPWRWRFITLWIIIFTAVVIWIVRDNRQSIHELKITKADITLLRKTDCGLSQFLRTARSVRIATLKHDTGKEAQADRAAVRGYTKLIVAFQQVRCNSPATGGG